MEELTPTADWLYFGAPDLPAHVAQRQDDVNELNTNEGEEMAGIQLFAAAPIGQPPQPFRFPNPCDFVPVDCPAPHSRKVGTMSEPTAEFLSRACMRAPLPRSGRSVPCRNLPLPPATPRSRPLAHMNVLPLLRPEPYLACLLAAGRSVPCRNLQLAMANEPHLRPRLIWQISRHQAFLHLRFPCAHAHTRVIHLLC